MTKTIGRPKIATTPSRIKLKNNPKGISGAKKRLADSGIWQSMIDSNPLVVVCWKQTGCSGCKPFETRVMSKTDKQYKTIPRIDIELVHDKKDPMEELANKYGIDQTPTAILLKSGKEVGRVTFGSAGEEDPNKEFKRDLELMQRLLETNA